MKINLLKSRRGVTLVETLIAAGLLSLVLIGTIVLLTTMLNIWSKGSSGTSANSYASLAMRKLVLSIEEGKSASVSNDRLTIVYPYLDTTTGDYDRTGSGVTAVYYLSGPTGLETSGELTYLWKAVGADRTRLAKQVMRLDENTPPFLVTNERLVRIAFKGWDQQGGAISPNEIRMSVKLRNN